MKAGGYQRGVEREQAQAFEVSERTAAGIPVLELAGELDYAAVAPIEVRLEAFIDQGCKKLVVDLSRARLLTSSVINVLFAAVRRLHLVGGGLSVVCSDPVVCKPLELTAFDQAAPVYRTEREALDAAAG